MADETSYGIGPTLKNVAVHFVAFWNGGLAWLHHSIDAVGKFLQGLGIHVSNPISALKYFVLVAFGIDIVTAGRFSIFGFLLEVVGKIMVLAGTNFMLTCVILGTLVVLVIAIKYDINKKT